VGRLSASGESEQSIDLTAPADPGTYYYGACVDTVTGESDRTDNCSVGVTVTVVRDGGAGVSAVAVTSLPSPTQSTIGARTTESQVHRELASGLSMPVGFKNGTDGNIQIAIDAMGAALRPHAFLGVTKQGVAAIVETSGNQNCHVILRGSNAGTNFDSDSVADVTGKLEGAGLPGRVMVDCSHGNSRKKHANQPLAAESLAEQVGSGSTGIFGLMMESHLVEGNQSLGDDLQALTYGQSITDACLGWPDTERLVRLLADG